MWCAEYRMKVALAWCKDFIGTHSGSPASLHGFATPELCSHLRHVLGKLHHPFQLRMNFPQASIQNHAVKEHRSWE